MNYDIAIKEALKDLARSCVQNQSRFVTQTIKRFVKSEEIKEFGIAFSVNMLIKFTKQSIDEIRAEETKTSDVSFMVYKYIALETVNSFGSEILKLYEQNKAASVDDICKGIEAISIWMQSEEYLDDKISKFIEEVKVDKG